MRGKRNASGYALIAALILVMMASLATTVAVNAAQLDAQRERELQLLFVGNQFRDALTSYYASAAGGDSQFPETLQQLLIDERWPQARHHLRKLWPDPITNGTEWVLVRSQGRIVGVHSRSAAKPLKRANFGPDEDFSKAESYWEWVFMAREFAAGASTQAPPPPATKPADSSAPVSILPPANRDPSSAAAEAAQAPVPTERNAACMREYFQELTACATGDAVTAEGCRRTARDELRTCLP